MPKDSTSSKHTNSDDEYDGGDIDIIDVADFNIKNLSVPPIDEKRSSDSQYHAFPVYTYGKKKDKLTFKTKPIKITKGGIPKMDEKWRKTDAKREYMWLGEDDEQEGCRELFKALREIDDHFNPIISYDADKKTDPNLESNTVVLQKDKKKIEPLTVLDYFPIVRPSVQGENKSEQEYIPYNRCKLRFAKKFDKDRPDGAPSELTTALFLGDKEEPEDVKYPSDFEKYLRWNCTAQFVLQVSKFRCKKAIDKDKKGKQTPRDCAFDINILQVIIVEEAPKSGASNADKYRKRMFPAGKASNVQIEAKKSIDKESSSESESETETESETESDSERDSGKDSGKDSEKDSGKNSGKKSETNKKSEASKFKKTVPSSESDNSTESDTEDDTELSDSDTKKRSSSKNNNRKN